MDVPSYSRWVVVERTPGTRWKFRCVCGTEKTLNKYNILNGRSRSCGCLRDEVLVEQQSSTKHGMYRHPAYRSWINMRYRIKNHPDYINLPKHEPWENFLFFWEDMKALWFKGATLDRIDNEDGYNPQNCRWLESQGQPQNRRCVKVITWKGRRITLTELSRQNGHNPQLIASRLKQGWDLEKAVLTPSRKEAGQLPPTRLLDERIEVTGRST